MVQRGRVVLWLLGFAAGCGVGRVEPAPEAPNALPDDLGTTLPNEAVSPSDPVIPDPDPDPDPDPPPPAELVALSGGEDFSCFVRDDGLLRCWGRNLDLRALAPSGSFVDVVTADRFACALDEAGEIACWGWEPRVDAPGGVFESLAVGAAGGCAVDASGAVSCWGSGALTPPADLGAVTDVAVGDAFACALKVSDGTVRCWGSGAPASNPPIVEGLLQVVAGRDHACVMHPAGEALCWGANGQRQAEPRTGPFLDLKAGFDHSCGLRADGWLCWGDVGAELPEGLDLLGLGPRHACGRLDGELSCWGANDWLQASPPVLSGVAEVSVGRETGCLRTTDGALACFGEPASDEGVEVAPEGDFSRVALGYEHGCAITSQGQLQCWGSDTSGASTPPEGSFVALDSGLNRSCALRDDGELVCWGAIAAPASPLVGLVGVALGDIHACAWNALNQAQCWGGGSGVDIPDDLPVVDISGGSRFGVALLQDGRLAAWGANSRRRTDVADGDNFIAATAGRIHACALRDDATAVCWGDAAARDVPSDTYSQISAGEGFTCGVSTAGELRCWGDRVR